MAWNRTFPKELKIERYNIEELKKAIKDLEKRGFELVKIITQIQENQQEHMKNGKRLTKKDGKRKRTSDNLANTVKNIAILKPKKQKKEGI